MCWMQPIYNKIKLEYTNLIPGPQTYIRKLAYRFTEYENYENSDCQLQYKCKCKSSRALWRERIRVHQLQAESMQVS